MAFRVLLAIGMVTGCSVGAAVQEQPDKPLAWHEVYQKADTWPDTMLLCRARFQQWQAAGPSDKAFPAVDLAIRRIRLAGGPFAVYEHRVVRDWAELRLPGAPAGQSRATTPLDWFNATGTEIERGLIRLVLDRIETDCEIAKLATAAFRGQLSVLEREEVRADDLRWLQLYCTVTDWEEQLAPLAALDTFGRSASLISQAFGDECAYSPEKLQKDREQLDARWAGLFRDRPPPSGVCRGRTSDTRPPDRRARRDCTAS